MMEAEESHPKVTTKKGATEKQEQMATSSTTTAPKQPPPSIQLDDNASKPENKDDHPPAEKRDADEKSFGQLRTPKHANKTVGGSGSRDEASPPAPSSRGFSRDDNKSNQPTDPQQQQQGYPTQEKAPHTASGQEYYGEGYNQYRGGQAQQQQQDPNAAAYYAARMRMMHQQPPTSGAAPQTISPGGTASGMPPAYRTGASGYSAAAYAMQTGRYQQEGYRQGEFPGYRGQQGGQYAGYPDSRYQYGDGSRHPQYGQGVPPNYPTSGQQRTPHAGHYDPRYAAQAQQGNMAPFTRAVSNSFDRSTKSVDNVTSRSSGGPPQGQGGKVDQATTMSHHAYYQQEPAQHLPPDASVPDDHSWGALNQVASVDDSTLARARIAQQLGQNPGGHEDKTVPESADDKEIRQPPSTSSSLTNSPVEGNETAGNTKPNPSPSKMAPLDSLSSVASAQEPMDTTASKDSKESKPTVATGGPASPGSSNGSLDLMKCHSGSSGLLNSFPGTHGRSMSGSSFLLDSKRSRDFAAEGARVVDGPPSKKTKASNATEDDKTKGAKREGKSPLSVDCSPPKPSSDKQRAASAPSAGNASSLQDRVTAAAAGRTSTSPAYMGYPSLDRAPSYTYSIDSVPSKEYTYPPLPPRPGSSSSSTVGPAGGNGIQIDGPLASTDAGNRGDSLVANLPSWDILHAQDSFGAGSVGAGGAPIVGNFSFSQDYPLLSGSMSNLGSSSALNPAQAQANQQGAQQEGHHHGPPTSLAESRNQSFEGGHYHGGDVTYTAGGTQKGSYKQQQYPIPPQAPSWGTASSSNSTQPTQPGASYQQQHAAQLAQYRTSSRSFQGGAMLRNYSEESGARTSPPAAGAASGFQPPSDFVAPRHPQLRRPPPQAVYIMSSDGRKPADPSLVAKSNAGGVYGWTKAEDDALTEVMKKFKNPRDWEPIAKEHSRGKSAKECHERWIRYLKPGVRKGQWTDHEDAIVVEAVSSSSEQPFTRWSDLAQKLPGRVGKQIRDRWVNHLNPNINHMPFSREDDLLLWEGHKQLGKRWVEISTKFFNSSRSENHIKNRWYSASFKKFIANEYGPNAHSGGGKSSAKKGKKSSVPKPTNTAAV